MYTQCPKCDTWFNITAAHLRAAEGMVQCSRCQHQFNALDYLSEAPPPIDQREAARTASVSAVDGGAELERNADVINMSEDDVDITPISTKKPASDQPRIVAERNVHAATTSRLSRLISWVLWLTLSGAALVVLAVQAVYWLPEQNISGWGFMRSQVCSVLDCPTGRYDRQRVKILSKKRTVSKPENDQQIVNSGSIINNAEYPQPFPVLRMGLRDSNNKILGLRDFYSHEYLAKDVGLMLPPGEKVKYRIVARNPLVGNKWDMINVDTTLHFAPAPHISTSTKNSD